MKKKKKANGKSSTKKTRTPDQPPDDPADAVGEPSPDEATSKGGRPPRVDYKEFVRAWRDANTVAEAAEQLGIKANSASTIAIRLRKAGIELKKFSRTGAQPIDVKALNRINSGKDD